MKSASSASAAPAAAAGPGYCPSTSVGDDGPGNCPSTSAGDDGWVPVYMTFAKWRKLGAILMTVGWTNTIYNMTGVWLRVFKAECAANLALADKESKGKK